MNIRTATLLGSILVVALLLRVAAGVFWQERLTGQLGAGQFGFGDSESYWVLAGTIARGEPYQYGTTGGRVFRTPGYPALLTPLFVCGGENPPVAWARAISALLGTLAVGCVWWLARQLFDTQTAWVAAAMVAVYPGAIVTGALVLSEAPFCPLMVLQLALWTAAWQSDAPRRRGLLAIAAGLTAGAATLMRPSWLLFTPLIVVLGIVAGRENRRRHAWIGLGLLAGLAAVMTPWWIRNARVTGHFVPTTLQVGASLYDGLGPQADGSSNLDFVAGFIESEAAAETTGAEPLEVRLDRRMRQEAWRAARADPARAVRLAGVKLARMWNLWPNEPKFSTPPVRLVVACTYVPLLLLALIGAWRTAHRGWPYLLCWLPAVYLTALHVVFVSSIRYRQPALLPMAVLAAAVLGKMKRKSSSPL
ncbi:MAG: glycosyltransferase family 39 protein [Planctomycetes bacterium]|nr:glycosyltransferase family 39 protein [Planctomycetota bacterium]